jgi:hypothetical protein
MVIFYSTVKYKIFMLDAIIRHKNLVGYWNPLNSQETNYFVLFLHSIKQNGNLLDWSLTYDENVFKTCSAI